MTPLVDPEVYLARMARPLQEKLKVAQFISPGAKNILDVGCADGVVTCALAEMFPHAQFLGIDLDANFVVQARERARLMGNARFYRLYLRELLAKKQKYDTVLFVSVLHEFFSYGEGISSVLKALCDARELLVKGGDIVIRDMVLFDYAYSTTYQVEEMLKKVRRYGDTLKLLQRSRLPCA